MANLASCTIDFPLKLSKPLMSRHDSYNVPSISHVLWIQLQDISTFQDPRLGVALVATAPWRLGASRRCCGRSPHASDGWSDRSGNVCIAFSSWDVKWLMERLHISINIPFRYQMVNGVILRISINIPFNIDWPMELELSEWWMIWTLYLWGYHSI